MIRNEELIDILVADLHFHHYIEMQSSNIFSDRGPLTIVVNDNQKKHIQRYVDDLFIDLFFRTHKFKPIELNEGWCDKKYTKDGVLNTKNQKLILNLNDPYDRYTFIDCISRLFGSHQNNYLSIFPNNHFIDDIVPGFIKYGSIGVATSLKLGSPNSAELYHYLNFKYGMEHSKFNPKFRTLEVMEYARVYQNDDIDYFDVYQNFSPFGLLALENRRNDYLDIKDSCIFGEYTIEDILMIYTLLVDKLEFKEDGLLEFIGLFYDSMREGNFLREFGEFELRNVDVECIKPYVRSKDLYLRFINREKSKAVTFTPVGNGFYDLHFFEQPSIRTATIHNTLPLPFLYDDLYNK